MIVSLSELVLFPLKNKMLAFLISVEKEEEEESMCYQ